MVYLRRKYNFIIVCSMASQLHKAIYFDDYQSSTGKSKSFSIAFTEDEMDLFKRVGQLSSYAIKKILKCNTYYDLKKKAERNGRPINQYAKRVIAKHINKVTPPSFQTKDVTFGNSKDVPFQRWYPYIEGYSPSFVEALIDKYCPNASLIYEPFAGTGTTIYSADNKGISTVYSEVNPLLQVLIDTKLSVMKLSQSKRKELASQLKAINNTLFDLLADSAPSEDLRRSYTRVFGTSIYFPAEQFEQVLRLKTLIENYENEGRLLLGKVLSIAVFSCLIPISYLKKQGDLRFKTEKERQTEMVELKEILPNKISVIIEDLLNNQVVIRHNHRLIQGNAKNIGKSTLRKKIDAVITSPPYLNGTNYFRNTKLELWFLSYLKSEDDLRLYRDEALTSGINDVKQEYSKLVAGLSSPLLDKTMDILDRQAYDRRIPLMARCYFKEMHEVFHGLSKNLNEGADILIDLGDSIFSNVHIQTDLILLEIIEPLGFKLINREVLRQRRSRNGSLLSQVLLVIKYNKV